MTAIDNMDSMRIGVKLINNLSYTDVTVIIAESEVE